MFKISLEVKLLHHVSHNNIMSGLSSYAWQLSSCSLDCKPRTLEYSIFIVSLLGEECPPGFLRSRPCLDWLSLLASFSFALSVIFVALAPSSVVL